MGFAQNSAEVKPLLAAQVPRAMELTKKKTGGPWSGPPVLRLFSESDSYSS